MQSATEQLSDEQQPASHEQSGHPEFPQLQPITNTAANNVIIFFIILFLRDPQTHGKQSQYAHLPFFICFVKSIFSILFPWFLAPFPWPSLATVFFHTLASPSCSLSSFLFNAFAIVNKCFFSSRHYISSILLALSSITMSQAGLIYFPLEPVDKSWNLQPQDSNCLQVNS